MNTQSFQLKGQRRERVTLTSCSMPKKHHTPIQTQSSQFQQFLHDVLHITATSKPHLKWDPISHSQAPHLIPTTRSSSRAQSARQDDCEEHRINKKSQPIAEQSRESESPTHMSKDPDAPPDLSLRSRKADLWTDRTEFHLEWTPPFLRSSRQFYWIYWIAERYMYLVGWRITEGWRLEVGLTEKPIWIE